MKEYPGVPWQRAAEALVQQAKAALRANERVLGYLRDVRGLTDATIDRYDLGYAPYHNWGHHMIVGDQKHWYPSGILIPWRDGGILHQIRVRTHVGNFARYLDVAEDAGPDGRVRDKYMSVAGSKAMGHLWNVDALKPNGWVLIVEGEFDAMVALQELSNDAVPELWSNEADYSVITIGSATNRPDDELAHTLSEYHVLVCLDNDTAGQKAAEDIMNRIKNFDPEWQRLMTRLEAPDNPCLLRDLWRVREYEWRAQTMFLPFKIKDITDYVLWAKSGGLEDALFFWIKGFEQRQGWAATYNISDAQRDIDMLRAAQRFDAQHRLKTGIPFSRCILDMQLWIEACREGWATEADLEVLRSWNWEVLTPIREAFYQLAYDTSETGEISVQDGQVMRVIFDAAP